jgi:hypothetical protein
MSELSTEWVDGVWRENEGSSGKYQVPRVIKLTQARSMAVRLERSSMRS